MNDKRSEEIRRYIGSPEGSGKARGVQPDLGVALRRRVFTREEDLEEKETTIASYLGKGLGSIVYKGVCQGEEVVEKFTADIPKENGKKSASKSLMDALFFFFRQAQPSYRTNFYAVMANHYASLLIESASELEFGLSIIPRLQYTAYDVKSGGFILAYEYIEGRPIRPGKEEELLRENLKSWKDFLSDKLGLWGLARQCDKNNINSPGNVFVIDEDPGKMRLVDITPGVLGGQVYLLPLEFEYFFKGLTTGNFLPFGDAVDFAKLRKYVSGVSGSREKIEEYARNLEFYVKKWRESEPALLRSPVRIFHYLFNKVTIKATLRTAATELEYKGVIGPDLAGEIRLRTESASGRMELIALRLKICRISVMRFFRDIPRILWRFVMFVAVDVLWGMVRFTGELIRVTVKVYTSRAFRRKVSREKIEKWISDALNRDRWITREEAAQLEHELKNIDVLGIIELEPLWAAAKIVKPPFVGTAANMAFFVMFTKTLNPYWLVLMLADGIIRFTIAVIFTGFKYKPLLVLSLIPSFGFVLPVPVQIMKDAPNLSEFIIKQVFGAGIGALLPGVDRHSFRVYYYIKLMDIPLVIIKWIVKIFA